MIRSSILLLLSLFLIPVHALDSDKEQPATLDADDFEMDFKTGVRIYRGNVIFRQGSIRLTCDELTTYMNANDELDKAICVGSPGTFKQRPEGHDEDVNGQAMEITMDEIEQLVTLKSRAKVVQGGTALSGRIITYDMALEKVRVKGGGTADGQATTQTTGTATEATVTSGATSGDASGEAVASEDQPSTAATSGSSRPSIVIQPRKKKTTE